LRGSRFFRFACAAARVAMACGTFDGMPPRKPGRRVPKRKVKADDADHQPVDPQTAGGAKGA
jgi:hypothetical protein